MAPWPRSRRPQVVPVRHPPAEPPQTLERPTASQRRLPQVVALSSSRDAPPLLSRPPAHGEGSVARGVFWGAYAMIELQSCLTMLDCHLDMANRRAQDALRTLETEREMASKILKADKKKAEDALKAEKKRVAEVLKDEKDKAEEMRQTLQAEKKKHHLNDLGSAWLKTEAGRDKLTKEGMLAFQLGRYMMQRAIYTMLRQKDATFDLSTMELQAEMEDLHPQEGTLDVLDEEDQVNIDPQYLATLDRVNEGLIIPPLGEVSPTLEGVHLLETIDGSEEPPTTPTTTATATPDLNE
nr:tubby-related protein 1-like isoform X2 [Ipomoea trifida]